MVSLLIRQTEDYCSRLGVRTYLLQHELHKWSPEYDCDRCTNSAAIYRSHPPAHMSCNITIKGAWPCTSHISGMSATCARYNDSRSYLIDRRGSRSLISPPSREFAQKIGCVYALEKLYFFGIIKNEPKLDGVASFNYGVPMATFQLHHQTLITTEYQSTRQDESNEPKLDGVASFNYGVPMATF
ncbi:hypothetical protein EVAR_75109_1 [Eumeta japonica]|uniref:Uncharacterized protein n=1 Tax=Eumeta variegata TaxID=151549 RepID=A0A4C1U0U2_EUMVA|nr:hypothetical protein EVAR_75109_1 [Eumeta japonica]